MTEYHVKAGDRFDWHGVLLEVTRVGRNGLWADLRVHEPSGSTWSKRQPLPLPKDSVRLDPS
jgi:hypothetical protein